MNKILITGGCGFIGANLIARMNEVGGYSIVVIDDESLGKYEWIKDLDVKFMKGSLLEKDILRSALEGVDSVVHLAADTRVIPSIENPVHNFDTNVIGTFNLLTAMKECGVEQIVSASTGGAILGDVEPPVHEEMVPKPISPYGASKLACEAYCSAFAGSYGFLASSLRFSNVYGIRSFHKGSVVAQFFRNILNKIPLTVYGNGTQTRDYVFASDLADGIIGSLNSNVAGVYQLGTGIPTSLNELISAISTVVGEEQMVPVEYVDFRDGEIRNTYCDISRARERLDYNPLTTLDAGLRVTWNWFVENRSLFEKTG
ncbi:NAD-dependent epimerase/dehydratase family protein [Parvularcula sp. IMCC14364]|uniref:NAD-dependent epimerase/dehydratase family protein n=1 Tax=Parvularcula sp. IMCC14364 TaxID=3067902 RepID=UPI00274215CA|nr:NAD-dependent epimerase/dehydratase family protein [Parvularcula sp. IMCC14364]